VYWVSWVAGVIKVTGAVRRNSRGCMLSARVDMQLDALSMKTIKVVKGCITPLMDA
jgi:hypothetical protein